MSLVLRSPRQLVNSLNSYVDASNVYGHTVERADSLRQFAGGRLATSGDGTLAPLNPANTGFELFLFGEVRANENPSLASLHTLFLREHNRCAGLLTAANASASDEEVYQGCRRFVGGLLQRVTYEEYLPALLGTRLPPYSGYKPAVNAGVATEVRREREGGA